MEPHTPGFERLADVLSLVLLGICYWGGLWFRKLIQKDRIHREAMREELEKLKARPTK